MDNIKTTVYIDSYGRIGVCDKFNDAELNELLTELVDDDFYGDRYTEYAPGFYTAIFKVESGGPDYHGDYDEYLVIKNIEEKNDEATR